jgi:histidinol-phosphate aminotransferase
MIQIPENIQSLKTYKPGKPNADMFAEWNIEKPVVLCSNENNFGPSPKALEAIREVMFQLHRYPDPTGENLRLALAERLEVNFENLILGNGSDGILYSLFKAFFLPGQKLLTSEASFVSIDAMAKMNHVAVEKVPLKAGYRFDLDAIFDRIDSATKGIYLCNPNNPTGTAISREELCEFLSKVPKHLLIIVDEAYFEFAKSLTDQYPDSTKLHFDNLLTLRTFSKAYGLAGLRLGYAIGSPQLINALAKVKLTFNPNSLAQAACLAALEDEQHFRKTIQNNQSGLQGYYRTFEDLGIPFVPSFANFAMINLGTEERVERLYQQLLHKGVLIRRLSSFGLPHCARISVGTPAENLQLKVKLEEIFATTTTFAG